MTDTIGLLDTVSGATIARISYYNFVRRAFLISVMTLFFTLTGCYSGTRPPHVGTSAPDFTVQDNDRKVSLQDLVDEALDDLLKKHHRPVTTKDMFAESLKAGRPKRK